MIYTSKRRKFKDFLKTRNWSYYFIFLVLFATIMTCVFIGISKADKNKTDNPTTAPGVTDNNVTTDEDAKPIAKGNYKICVNLGNYQISIYEWDPTTSEYGKNPIKCMPAGININLPKGEHSFKEDEVSKSNWYTTNSGDIFRYYTIFSDDIVFHTARYQEHNNKNSLDVISYNSIGKTVYSDGITLLCSDAKWIYENCSASSIVYIYDDPDEAISETITQIMSIPNGLTWDPSDTSNGSTFCPTKVATIKCVYDYVNINQHANVDFVKTFVKATDEYGNDISSYVFTDISGKFDEIESLEMNFYVADLYGNVITDSIIVHVVPTENESETPEDESASDEASSEEATEPSTDASKEENTTGNTEKPTEPPTEPPTEAETVAPTEPETEPNTEPETEPVTEPEPITETDTESDAVPETVSDEESESDI